MYSKRIELLRLTIKLHLLCLYVFVCRILFYANGGCINVTTSLHWHAYEYKASFKNYYLYRSIFVFLSLLLALHHISLLCPHFHSLVAHTHTLFFVCLLPFSQFFRFGFLFSFYALSWLLPISRFVCLSLLEVCLHYAEYFAPMLQSFWLKRQLALSNSFSAHIPTIGAPLDCCIYTHILLIVHLIA